MKLAFNGAGVLDNFDAKLDFAAGPDVWARGDVVVARQGAGRRLIVDLNSRIEGMTPPIIRPVFAGETTLKGDLFFDDDSTIATPGLHVVSANTRLDIEGGRSADDTVGLKIHAGAIPGATQIGKLDHNVSIVGSALVPSPKARSMRGTSMSSRARSIISPPASAPSRTARSIWKRRASPSRARAR